MRLGKLLAPGLVKSLFSTSQLAGSVVMNVPARQSPTENCDVARAALRSSAISSCHGNLRWPENWSGYPAQASTPLPNRSYMVRKYGIPPSLGRVKTMSGPTAEIMF